MSMAFFFYLVKYILNMNVRSFIHSFINLWMDGQTNKKMNKCQDWSVHRFLFWSGNFFPETLFPYLFFFFAIGHGCSDPNIKLQRGTETCCFISIRCLIVMSTFFIAGGLHYNCMQWLLQLQHLSFKNNRKDAMNWQGFHYVIHLN